VQFDFQVLKVSQGKVSTINVRWEIKPPLDGIFDH